MNDRQEEKAIGIILSTFGFGFIPISIIAWDNWWFAGLCLAANYIVYKVLIKD